MPYDGSIELLSGLKTKNNGSFALIDAPDVRIDDTTRLSDFVQSINNKEGSANGFATLDQNGKVPSNQLPSYVDDVLEYDSQSGFPSIGETGKIYVDKSTNKSYRWSGSQYIVIASDLALGETSSTAYRGDHGKAAYDHATAKGTAYSSGLYKITTNAEGHVTSATAVQKSDITGFNLNKSDVGLGNVDNTADTDKPVSTAVQTELDKKVNKTIKVNGHALSSDVTVTKSDVSLGNVDNTADTDKPVSTAQQAALNLKADLRYVNELFSGNSTQDLLQLKNIPDTIKSITYDINNHVSQIIHTNQNGNEVVRTDAFTFALNAITEVRTLNTGESLTIVFDSQNMTTTATYASA